MHSLLVDRSNTFFFNCDHFPVHKSDMLNFLSANDPANVASGQISVLLVLTSCVSVC